jgi:hypothetical protein
MAVRGHLAGTAGQVHGPTHHEPGRGLLVEDRPDQRTLPCLENVSIPQRDPEALQACRRLVAVVELLARPSLLSWLVDLKLENVPVLDLVSIRADVVDDLP